LRGIAKDIARMADPTATKGPGGADTTLPVTSRLHAGYAHPTLRAWQTERTLSKEMLVYPIFVTDKPGVVADPITAMPGQFRYSVAALNDVVSPLVAKGLPAVLLFGVPESAAKVCRLAGLLNSFKTSRLMPNVGDTRLRVARMRRAHRRTTPAGPLCRRSRRCGRPSPHSS